MRFSAVLVVVLCWPLTAGASDGCLQALLERLGWQFEAVAAGDAEVHGGPVCTRGTADESRVAGDMRVRVPAALGGPERDALLQSLVDHPATVCAFSMRLGDAARRAGTALQDNPGYRFSGLQLGWIGFGAAGADRQGWQRTHALGRGFQPGSSNSAALEAFYSGQVRSECGVGRQVAQLATQRELFGDAAFDTAFSAGELSIGTFLTLHRTDSILLGGHAGELQGDGKGVRASALGRQAFMGVPGFIEHAYGRETLDDLNNQAENFIVLDVGDDAADALHAHGGLAWYDQRNAELWALSRQVPRRGVRFFERLLVDREPALRASLTLPERKIIEAMDRLLEDPFYREFQIYVHPRGIKPIGAYIARLLDRNPRTPFAIELALHNLHTTLYQRWMQAQLQHCAATRQPGRLTTDSSSGPDGALRPGSSTQR